ncbi:hypothetical protein CBR_g48843 [Chara braunii]|uniref:Cation-transporting ATPase n=1 Tax=Chara braunii TaxID=69332 RepID=A0A388M3M0_CHABU|nr:hypothetical protein CBR_g48843 [Chara braunii]|eukprot:GBG89136.1 hypothetical protein CBR_g48843 [Chara braunii]
MAIVDVSAKTVRHVELFRKISTARRLDVWPFVCLYLLWIGLVFPSLETADGLIVLAGIGMLHILTMLCTVWSVDFRCFAHYQKAKDLKTAEFCKVVPEKYSGSKEVVPLLHRKLAQVQDKKAGGAGNLFLSSQLGATDEEVRFDFRKQTFVYSPEEGVFEKVGYPSKETFGTYMKCTGHASEARAEVAKEKWGPNVFDFPQPTFGKLFKEQCMEPFFVFQVFCVGLWCLDEYWYYSVFTLFMLLLFESTVVKSRIRTLMELRQVAVDKQSLLVYRGGKWVRLSGIALLPGDIVSLGRTTAQGSEERTVPADMLLLAGTVIANEALLTGESTPQWKVPVTGRDPTERLAVKRDKTHVLFGGTKILQHTPDKTAHLKTPDNGCVAIVLRTGFNTSQGKLMRTILFSTERVTANNWESGLFIMFLVVFALMAAGYVLMKGLEDPNRSRYKLLLNCSLIITSVIPPELPMELSIAVNTSLIALARKGIYCTEPFRIPFGGKVDVCCFDKTGTLTTDDMEFRGVVEVETKELITESKKLPEMAASALAACHSLVFVDNKLVGDPLEKAAIKGAQWCYTSDERAFPKGQPRKSVQILHRFHFASHLKRMSVIVSVDPGSASSQGFLVLVKGAPETIQSRLVTLPAGYVEAYKQFTRQGSRVLALAYKHLPDMPIGELRSIERDDAESGLHFSGFAVFACPLRRDSASTLLELKDSSHELVMITGDQALTAVHVASQVHIVSRPVLVLTLGDDGSFSWISPDEAVQLPFRIEEVEQVASTYDLCVAGEGLAWLARQEALDVVIPRVQVYARVSPDQKEMILTTLKGCGRVTLMCGDGTNDVGALKQAHVGVALLNVSPPPKSSSIRTLETSSSHSPTSTLTGVDGRSAHSSGGVMLNDGANRRRRSQSSSSRGGGLAAAIGPQANGVVQRSGRSLAGSPELGQVIGGSSSTDANGAVVPLTPAELQRQRLLKKQEQLKAMMDEMDQLPTVKLGDASMASPFTAKHASVQPTLTIIKQGRCTLVTTMQMFKILGLNCLAMAYVLSVMSLDGVKVGDIQAMISGLFTAAFFLFISHAKPLTTLSPERPHAKIFSWYVMLSLMGQFAVHLTFLVMAVRQAEKHMPEECIDPDSEFTPNLVNTVSYTVNMMIQCATFAVNYVGHPFNQSVVENKPFFYALIAAAGFFTVLTSDTVRSLNDSLKLVPLPEGMGHQLLLMSAADLVVTYTIERLARWAFPSRVPSLSARRTRGHQASSVEKED